MGDGEGTRSRLREAARRAIEHHERCGLTGDPELVLRLRRGARGAEMPLFSRGGPTGRVAGTERDWRGRRVTVAAFKAYEVLDCVGYGAAVSAGAGA